MKVAIIGAGSRGVNVYGNILTANGVRISAVCDIDRQKVINAKTRFSIAEEACFFDEDKFFEAGQLGDGLVIASMDQDHYRQAIKAIKTGYKKILLEKPVSAVRGETEEIIKAAKENGVDILVCHELRYSGFYKTIKEVI
ncbi:MAG: Gfo/Idh/MocA family oxidoreductase, partial [Clostridiales bacterium]|nr:Gfo/Idh/MocA family oxidoreductase [Clostridiales bacterium]